jgi:hypothetical protein
LTIEFSVIYVLPGQNFGHNLRFNKSELPRYQF